MMGVISEGLDEERESGEKWIKCKNCKKKFTQTIHKGKKSLPVCPHCGTHNINEGLHDTSWENENGEKVSLLDLVKVTEKIPVVDFPVELLKDKVLSWDNDPNEQKKIDKSSLQYPILIFVDDDGEFLSIIDGHHRVQKAIKLGREFIDAKIITLSKLPKDMKVVFKHLDKKEEKEGAGAYDAPAFEMKPDHITFKKEGINEQEGPTKILDVPHYLQSDDSTCGPASLRMVMAYYGLEMSEEDIAGACGHTYELGCRSEDMVCAAKSLGFNTYMKNNSKIEEIIQLIDLGVPVIVDWFCGDPPEGHSSVVVGYDSDNLYILDPYLEEMRVVSKYDFRRCWFDFYETPITPDNLYVGQIMVLRPTGNLRKSFRDKNIEEGVNRPYRRYPKCIRSKS